MLAAPILWFVLQVGAGAATSISTEEKSVSKVVEKDGVSSDAERPLFKRNFLLGGHGLTSREEVMARIQGQNILATEVGRALQEAPKRARVRAEGATRVATRRAAEMEAAAKQVEDRTRVDATQALEVADRAARYAWDLKQQADILKTRAKEARRVRRYASAQRAAAGERHRVAQFGPPIDRASLAKAVHHTAKAAHNTAVKAASSFLGAAVAARSQLPLVQAMGGYGYGPAWRGRAWAGPGAVPGAVPGGAPSDWKPMDGSPMSEVTEVPLVGVPWTAAPGDPPIGGKAEAPPLGASDYGYMAGHPYRGYNPLPVAPLPVAAQPAVAKPGRATPNREEHYMAEASFDPDAARRRQQGRAATVVTGLEGNSDAADTDQLYRDWMAAENARATRGFSALQMKPGSTRPAAAAEAPGERSPPDLAEDPRRGKAAEPPLVKEVDRSAHALAELKHENSNLKKKVADMRGAAVRLAASEVKMAAMLTDKEAEAADATVTPPRMASRWPIALSATIAVVALLAAWKLVRVGTAYCRPKAPAPAPLTSFPRTRKSDKLLKHWET